jgi:16S rRNA (uracil1498-N3)-methyltransferase
MRVYLLSRNESTLSPGASFQPEKEREHYLLQVLRLEPGSLIPGMGRDGRLRPLRLESAKPCTIHILPGDALSPDQYRELFREVPASTEKGETAIALVLVQALLKGKKMEQVIRQASEIGVKNIIPVHTQHSIPDFSEKGDEKKRKRWHSIICEAVQQSGSAVIPELSPTVELKEGLKRVENDALGLYFHEKPLAQLSLHRYLSGGPQRVAIAIGPEGGFGPKDLTFLASAGFKAFRIPGNILRAETAAIAALSMVKSILSEKDEWRLRDE